MNERIKELFHQATFEEDRIVNGIYYPYIPLQFAGELCRLSVTSEQYHKFAELIVKDCVQRLRQEGELATIQAFVGSTYKFAYMNEAANIIKQHFGVEE